MFSITLICLLHFTPTANAALTRKASHSWGCCAELRLHTRGPTWKKRLGGRGGEKRMKTKAEQRDIVRRRETKLNNYRELTRAAAQPNTCAGCLPSSASTVQCALCLYLTCHLLSPFISSQSLNCSPHLWRHFSHSHQGFSVIQLKWRVPASPCQGQTTTILLR